MGPGVIRAISRGYSANSVLGSIAKSNPNRAVGINNALALGYSAPSILSRLSNDDEEKNPRYKTSRQKTKSRDKERHRTIKKNVGYAAALTAALAAGGAYALNSSRAIQPDAILPAIRNQIGNAGGGTTLNARAIPRPQLPDPTRGLPAPVRGLPNRHIPPNNSTQPPSVNKTPPPIRPNPSQPIAQSPIINQPTAQTPKPFTPSPNVELIKNLKQENRLTTAIKSAISNKYDLPTTALIFKASLQKDVAKHLENQEGGIQKVVEDYKKYLENNPELLQERDLKGKHESLIGNKIKNENESENIRNESENIRNESPIIPFQQEENKPEKNKPEKNITPQLDIKKSDIKNSFSIPNYRLANETESQFQERKLMNEAVNKAAHEIKMGKNFTDIKTSDETTYSTASDVLKFLAGIPNSYSEILNEDEQEELMNGLESSNDHDIYGAQITPNLVWNMLLAVEPKIAKMKLPASMSSDIGKPENTTKLRRTLTHAVNGVLSGKKISFELADKIDKISKATQGIDVILNAIKEGNLKKSIAEMEKLSDDKYFLQVFENGLDWREQMLTEEGKEKAKNWKSEDTKNAASLKAAETRKINKEKNKDKNNEN